MGVLTVTLGFLFTYIVQATTNRALFSVYSKKLLENTASRLVCEVTKVEKMWMSPGTC